MLFAVLSFLALKIVDAISSRLIRIKNRVLFYIPRLEIKMPWEHDLPSGYAASGHFSLGFFTAVVLLQLFYFHSPELVKSREDERQAEIRTDVEPVNGGAKAPISMTREAQALAQPSSLLNATEDAVSCNISPVDGMRD